jgi:ribonuclease HI
MSRGFFITIYTDASVRPKDQTAQVAWLGKCSEGTMRGFTEVPYHKSSTRVEMLAIYYAIKDALGRWPHLEGFFINSDNMGCVTAFWTFNKNRKIPETFKDIHQDVAMLVGPKWIRTKHVKAHTNRNDVRSHMNREVDRLTRRKPPGVAV